LAAQDLEKEDISCEVIDPRTLYPFDKACLFSSIEKTNRLVLVTEEIKEVAFTADIAALVAEEAFDNLDAPIIRVGAINTPVPFSKVLENYYLPSIEDIKKAVRSIV